jgi:hypothetical protein
MIRPHVVVDGSNIATEGRSTPSLRQLDEAVQAFIAEHPSDLVTVVVDATFGHRIDPAERAMFDEAVSSGEIITAPAGAIGRGDAFILQIADKADATILSNDSFQEFHGQYEWLFDEGRLVGGKPVPGVGWVFLLRNPVRGPASRRAVKGAKEKAGKDRADKDKAAKEKAGKDKTRVDRGHREKAPKEKEKHRKDRDADEEARRQGEKDKAARRGRKKRSKPSEPINELLPFLDFVGSHPVGTVVNATVTRFSSHGAYVDVDGVTCYVPLRLLGDPPPRSAREVLKLGETRRFVVHTIDPVLRGIDLVLVATRDDEHEPTRDAVHEDVRDRLIDRSGDASEVHEMSPAVNDDATKANTGESSVATTFTADQHAEEAQVTPANNAATKRAAKKAATKKATAKKAATKKAATKKVAAKKAPAKKAATKKATAKKAATKKTATKKVGAKKAPAKKTATKKATAKKAATKKAATKKVAAKKAPAKKATAARRVVKTATRR